MPEFTTGMSGPAAVAKLEALWLRVTEQLSGTSTTSLTVGTGAKSLVTQASKQFAIGQSVRITRTSDVAVWMQGIVTAYNATSGALDVNVDTISGAGTFTDWTISLTGGSGPAGPAGADGADGADGAAATITVGTVTTGAPGSSVIINNSGTSSAAVFDFTIPRGDTGASGSGTGDVVGPAASVDGEVALFDATTGKLIKRATGSGIATLVSGVLTLIANSTDNFVEGAANLYHTAARVRGTVLTGLSTAAGTVVDATHTVLEAIGFLQNQVSARVAKSGDTMSGKMTFAPSVAGGAMANIGPGANVTSGFVDGDIWGSGGKMWFRGSAISHAIVMHGYSTDFAAGARQKMTASASTAGLAVAWVAGDPSGLAAGDIWCNSTDGLFKIRDNGAVTRVIVFGDLAQTLTNKRITARVGTTASSATPAINTDNVDVFRITAQTVDITSMTTNLSGTPADSDVLVIEITGTAARAITWGASFEASTVALPTTTVGTAKLTVGFLYNSVTSKWRCMAAV